MGDPGWMGIGPQPPGYTDRPLPEPEMEPYEQDFNTLADLVVRACEGFYAGETLNGQPVDADGTPDMDFFEEGLQILREVAISGRALSGMVIQEGFHTVLVKNGHFASVMIDLTHKNHLEVLKSAMRVLDDAIARVDV